MHGKQHPYAAELGNSIGDENDGADGTFSSIMTFIGPVV
jgi:hypothetical protein